MTEKKRPPAIVLFSSNRSKWNKAKNLTVAINKSQEVVVMWDKGRESIFYLDRKVGNTTHATN